LFFIEILVYFGLIVTIAGIGIVNALK